jgi:hypothetical protein
MPVANGEWKVIELSEAGVYAYQQMAMDAQYAMK